ncbi:hypothetical protein ACFLYQ_07075 [Chloroflexota bacterium]
MAIDGTYNVAISTPMGSRTAKLTLKADGDALSGSISGEGYEGKEFSGGKVSGNEVSMDVTIPSPMGGDIKLDFKGTVNGDEISGEVQLGSYGTNSFSGTRA